LREMRMGWTGLLVIAQRSEATGEIGDGDVPIDWDYS
jgi:hypothetical protein